MKNLALWVLLLFIGWSAQAQKKTTIRILNADVLEYMQKDGEKIKKLNGNVRLKHKDILLNCDSALLYDDDRKVDAGGNVHIQQDDTVNMYGEALHYDSEEQLAVLNKNVRMTNPRMELTTEKMTYKMDEKIAYYTQGGQLVDRENELTSQTGYYHTQTSDAYFKKDVHLVNPDYEINCDTLRYNTSLEMVYFLGPSTITSEENTIYCEYGWYDTRNDKSKFTKAAEIYTGGYVIKGDTLYYDRNTGIGQAVNNMVWRDTSGKTVITGDFGRYYEKSQRAVITKSPLLTSVNNRDSLFLTADTLVTYQVVDSAETITDTMKQYRIFNAYYDVKIFKESFQATCDSLKYSFLDSTFWLYYDPVLWTDNTQMSGDTISVLTQGNKIDKMTILRNAFIINKADTGLYNQIKGNHMDAIFRQDTLRKLFVEGNGQSVYFAEDDSGAYIGMNKAESSNLILRFKKNKVDEVLFLKEPEAVLLPMKEVKAADRRLENFHWREKERPESKRALLY